MKKCTKFITLMVSIVAFSAVTTSAFADSAYGISGGWSESNGYYINNTPSNIEKNPSASLMATGEPSETPNSHKGERQTKYSHDGDPSYAAHGETIWYYKYHYTTAQMELSNGTVKTSSGRVWGWNATEATSPYYTPGIFDNTEARTYWGG